MTGDSSREDRVAPLINSRIVKVTKTTVATGNLGCGKFSPNKHRYYTYSMVLVKRSCRISVNNTYSFSIGGSHTMSGFRTVTQSRKVRGTRERERQDWTDPNG
jgi:non-ribosomal peptide synthetase component E (peptide arylation enzyme)